MDVDESEVVVDMDLNGFLVGLTDDVMFSCVCIITSYWLPPQLTFDPFLSAGHRQKE